LTNVVVTDDKGVAVTCPKTTLDLLESMVCTAAGTAAFGQYENTGTLTATNAFGVEVTSSDISHYLGIASALTVEKRTNGQDADTPPGPPINAGAPVQWTYVVTNTGNVPILDVKVVDSDPNVVVTCPATPELAPGAQITCTASGTAQAGPYANTATVTAIDKYETPLTATDPSHYSGLAVAPQTLPAVGGRPLPPLRFATVALLAGGLLVMAARRRRPSQG
jgi:uncharacterized repeat protein (TIGR01451 family)